MGHPSETYLKTKSRDISFAHNLFISQLPNRFAILHTARFCHYRAMCKTLQRLGNWNWCNGRTRFREISVWIAFRADVLYFIRPHIPTHKHTPWEMCLLFQKCIFKIVIGLISWIVPEKFRWKLNDTRSIGDKLTSIQVVGWCKQATSHGPLTRYVKLRVAHARGIPGTFSPPPTLKETAS